MKGPWRHIFLPAVVTLSSLLVLNDYEQRVFALDFPLLGKDIIKNDGEGDMSTSSLRLSASNGNKDAQYFLGLLHHYGSTHVQKDEDVAFSYFRQAALQGHEEAQTNLGVLLLNGYGEPKRTDARAGLAWLVESAESGNADAQWMIGFIYYRGVPEANIPSNQTKAVKFFQSAVASGNKRAMYHLGMIYEYGTDTLNPDFSRAAALYAQASEDDGRFGQRGNLDAKYNLGLMHAYGRGVALDYGKALLLFKEAGDRGHGPSLYYLGLMNTNGKGCPVDYARALAYFREAAASSDVRILESATKALKELTAFMEKARANTEQSSRLLVDNADRPGEVPVHIALRQARNLAAEQGGEGLLSRGEEL